MNTHELCCVGHITLDKVVTPKNTVHMPGGTSFYFSHAIKHFDDIDYTLVTALAESEMKTVEELRAEGIDVAVMPSKHTVYFENIYGENQDNRTQRVLAKADPFTVEYLENINSKIFHLGSLLADDFSLEVVKYLAGKGLVSIDSQGYLPKEVVNATGAGDTYMTGYLYKRAKGASIEEAGRFAAAMTTLKIEGIGPFNGTKEDVLRCLETAEQRMPE